jgi:DNA-binding IclR family transcriptional regulator
MAATLEHCGFVERNHKSGLYTVSPMALHQVQKGVANNPYLTRIDLIMREVVERTGDAATHMIRKGNQALVMSRREGSSSLRVLAAEAGMEVPLHCGGAPLALVAFSSDAVIEDYLSRPLEKRTSSTTTNPEKLRELIAEFREQRYTVGNGDLFQYFVAVGVPVYGSAGDLIGAISVGDIAENYPADSFQEVGRILVEITSQY